MLKQIFFKSFSQWNPWNAWKPLCLVGVLMLIGCGPTPEAELKRQIKDALINDGQITVSEFRAIKNYVTTSEELHPLYSDNEALKQYITKVAENMGKRSRNRIELPVPIETGEEDTFATGEKSCYVFYENSVSMDGYLNGKTEFIDAALHLMTQMRVQGDKVNLFYVNKEAYPVNHIMSDYQRFLKPDTVRRYGERGNSEINRILKIVADTVCGNENRLAVLISDYIYSIQGRKVSDELDLQKHATTLNLLELPKKDYALLIIRVNSNFNGRYFPYNNTGVSINERRPVYFWVMGKRERILQFVEKYQVAECRGYDRHLIVQAEQKDEQLYYTILNKTFKKGRFKKQERGNTGSYKAMKEVERDQDGFQFAVAVDFSKCPVEASYLLDSTNYTIKTESGDEFVVSGIYPIEQIEHNDKDQRGSATHLLKITQVNSSLSKGTQTLTIVLHRKLPDWINTVSTENDLEPENRKGKTFGFAQLVEGAAKAFGYSSESSFVALPVTITN